MLIQVIHAQASTERAREQVLPKHQPQLEYLLERAAAPPVCWSPRVSLWSLDPELHSGLIPVVQCRVRVAIRGTGRTEEERPGYEGPGEFEDEGAQLPLLGPGVREKDTVKPAQGQPERVRASPKLREAGPTRQSGRRVFPRRPATRTTTAEGA